MQPHSYRTVLIYTHVVCLCRIFPCSPGTEYSLAVRSYGSSVFCLLNIYMCNNIIILEVLHIHVLAMSSHDLCLGSNSEYKSLVLDVSCQLSVSINYWLVVYGIISKWWWTAILLLVDALLHSASTLGANHYVFLQYDVITDWFISEIYHSLCPAEQIVAVLIDALGGQMLTICISTCVCRATVRSS